MEVSTHCRQGEEMLISTELTVDIGKKLQSMLTQITNDPSIVSKVNVVVLAVPSFAHGQFLEAFAPHEARNYRCCDAGAFGWRHPLLSVLGEKAKDIVFVGCEILRWAFRFTEWGRRTTFLGARRTSWRP